MTSNTLQSQKILQNGMNCTVLQHIMRQSMDRATNIRTSRTGSRHTTLGDIISISYSYFLSRRRLQFAPGCTYGRSATCSGLLAMNRASVQPVALRFHVNCAWYWVTSVNRSDFVLSPKVLADQQITGPDRSSEKNRSKKWSKTWHHYEKRSDFF